MVVAVWAACRRLWRHLETPLGPVLPRLVATVAMVEVQSRIRSLSSGRSLPQTILDSLANATS